MPNELKRVCSSFFLYSGRENKIHKVKDFWDEDSTKLKEITTNKIFMSHEIFILFLSTKKGERLRRKEEVT